MTTPSPSPSASPSASPSPSPTRSTAPKSKPLGTPGKFVFPVVGKYSYAHYHHDYPATDIITNCGNEVRAATSGVILEVTRVDKYKAKINAGATRGGLSVSIKGDDGIRYYGSHLEEINKNIQPGVRVTVGESLGKVGRTGDASACHLHFGISPICESTGDWWIQRGVVYPWPYLDSWRKGGDKSPVAAIKAWQKQHGCPKKPLVDP
ncbi:MAG TPA: M23 family metallopeptidase [Micromonosporaceae bacterium]